MDIVRRQPMTRVVEAALRDRGDPATRSDLLFLEDWRTNGPRAIAAMLRAGQLRRANPALAAAIDRELADGR